MSLGETIYKLRTERNLSQGDLAEMMEVSRQSVSKWENNSAVPDLEKIIKLSEIFDVSIDGLVKGEEKPRMIISNTTEIEPPKKEIGFPPRKIAGTILLCMAFMVVLCMLLGNMLTGLFLSLPFLTCGIIFFAFKKNVGLWCAWDVYVLFDIYISFATGISRSSVLHSFKWTHQMNYVRLAFAWVLVISLIVMMAITILRFSKLTVSTEEKGRNRLILSWGIVVLLQAIAMIWPHTEMYSYILENIFSMHAIYRLITILLGWTRIIAVTAALINTIRFVKSKQNKKE